MLRKTGLRAILGAGLALGFVAVELEAQVQGRHRGRLTRIENNIVPLDDASARFTIPDRMEHYDVPGVSVAVMEDGVVVWARVWGVRTAGEPLTTETLFQAASISKPVAALAALELVERGVLDLDRDVNEYLGSWKVPSNDLTEAAPVTLRGILSHTAGLTQHGFPGYRFGADIPTVPQILDGDGPANTGAVRVDIPPGSEWRYSGGGYTVLQLVLEEVTGKRFPELMRELVLDPLVLPLSTYEQPPPPDRWDELAHAHGRDGEPIDSDWHVYPEMAAAGLWTTPFELLRLMRDVQESWQGSVGRLLEPETARLMLEPVMGNYGLGFQIMSRDRDHFGHGGSNAGFKAGLQASMEGGSGIAVMTNGDRGSDLANEIVRAVAVEYGWVPPGGD